MAKIETIKTDLIEFKVFAAAKVFTLFAQLHGKSLFEFIQTDPQNMQGYADALYLGHLSASKLESVESKFSSDDILDRMDMNELVSATVKMLGLDGEVKEVDKKK